MRKLILVLAGFVHEQIHWFLVGKGRGASKRLRRRRSDIRVRPNASRTAAQAVAIRRRSVESSVVNRSGRFTTDC